MTTFSSRSARSTESSLAAPRDDGQLSSRDSVGGEPESAHEDGRLIGQGVGEASGSGEWHVGGEDLWESGEGGSELSGRAFAMGTFGVASGVAPRRDRAGDGAFLEMLAAGGLGPRGDDGASVAGSESASGRRSDASTESMGRTPFAVPGLPEELVAEVAAVQPTVLGTGYTAPFLPGLPPGRRAVLAFLAEYVEARARGVSPARLMQAARRQVTLDVQDVADVMLTLSSYLTAGLIAAEDYLSLSEWVRTCVPVFGQQVAVRLVDSCVRAGCTAVRWGLDAGGYSAEKLRLALDYLPSAFGVGTILGFVGYGMRYNPYITMAQVGGSLLYFGGARYGLQRATAGVAERAQFTTQAFAAIAEDARFVAALVEGLDAAAADANADSSSDTDVAGDTATAGALAETDATPTVARVATEDEGAPTPGRLVRLGGESGATTTATTTGTRHGAPDARPPRPWRRLPTMPVFNSPAKAREWVGPMASYRFEEAFLEKLGRALPPPHDGENGTPLTTSSSSSNDGAEQGGPTADQVQLVAARVDPWSRMMFTVFAECTWDEESAGIMVPPLAELTLDPDFRQRCEQSQFGKQLVAVLEQELALARQLSGAAAGDGVGDGAGAGAGAAAELLRRLDVDTLVDESLLRAKAVIDFAGQVQRGEDWAHWFAKWQPTLEGAACWAGGLTPQLVTAMGRLAKNTFWSVNGLGAPSSHNTRMRISTSPGGGVKVETATLVTDANGNTNLFQHTCDGEVCRSEAAVDNSPDRLSWLPFTRRGVSHPEGFLEPKDAIAQALDAGMSPQQVLSAVEVLRMQAAPTPQGAGSDMVVPSRVDGRAVTNNERLAIAAAADDVLQGVVANRTRLAAAGPGFENLWLDLASDPNDAIAFERLDPALVQAMQARLDPILNTLPAASRKAWQAMGIRVLPVGGAEANLPAQVVTVGKGANAQFHIRIGQNLLLGGQPARAGDTSLQEAVLHLLAAPQWAPNHPEVGMPGNGLTLRERASVTRVMRAAAGGRSATPAQQQEAWTASMQRWLANTPAQSGQEGISEAVVRADATAHPIFDALLGGSAGRAAMAAQHGVGNAPQAPGGYRFSLRRRGTYSV